jgi:hypothetical protein
MKKNKNITIAIELIIKKNFPIPQITHGRKLAKSERTKKIKSETIGNDLTNHAISFIETDFFWFSFI